MSSDIHAYEIKTVSNSNKHNIDILCTASASLQYEYKQLV